MNILGPPSNYNEISFRGHMYRCTDGVTSNPSMIFFFVVFYFILLMASIRIWIIVISSANLIGLIFTCFVTFLIIIFIGIHWYYILLHHRHENPLAVREIPSNDDIANFFHRPSIRQRFDIEFNNLETFSFKYENNDNNDIDIEMCAIERNIDSIDKTLPITIIEEEIQLCPICLEGFERQQFVTKCLKKGENGRNPNEESKTNNPVGCSHIYHKECLYQWLQKKDFCPLCHATVLNIPP